MRWQFEIHDGTAGGCRFVLRMSNGREALASEDCGPIESCMDAIMVLKARSSVRRAFVHRRSPDGGHAVAIVSGRDDVLATSPWFASRAAQVAAVLAIRALALTAPIVDCREGAGAGDGGVRTAVIRR